MSRIILVLVVLLFSQFLMAQPGAIDLSFNPGLGANNHVNAVAIQQDGKMIAVGYFLVFNGDSIYKIVRLNTDGAIDTSFHADKNLFADDVLAVTIQPDGKIIVGGNILSYAGINSPEIVRLNPDASLDTSFHVGLGFNLPVHSAKLQADGKILVGGKFTSYNGNSVGKICRLNIDGSLDTSFHSFPGAESTVEDILIQTNGEILIAGDFHIYNNTNSIRAALLNTNGTIDSSFVALPGASKAIRKLSLSDNNKIIAVGNFDTYDFQSKNKIVQLNIDGSIDVGLDMGLGANNEIHAVKKTASNIFIGGDFTAYNGYSINSLARLNNDGHIDTTFKIGTGANSRVSSIVTQNDGKIIIAGAFTSYNGVTRNRIARLYNCLTSQPGSISGSSTTQCSGILTYSIAPVSGASRYEWALPNGWSGSSDSTNITAISNGQGGVISVRAFSDSCGYSMAQTKTINGITPPAVSICLVTVDTTSTHNILIWEKPQTTLIDSFYVYRETASNVYTKIGAVPYDSISEYHDYGADPNMTSYRYKMSSLSKCGVELALSLYHNTIHLQDLGNGNFQWAFYEIENALNPVLNFNVYRDNLSNGSYSAIGNVPGTNATFTDVTANSFPYASYFVDVNWGITCVRPSSAVNTTRSNIKKRKPVGINDETNIDLIQLYPNPAEKVVYLSSSTSIGISQIQISNALGQLVWNENLAPTDNNTLKQIKVETLTKGIYILSLETSLGKINKKLIIE